MSFTIKRVELSQGFSLPYAEQGDPNGLPVIFLHGVTDSWRSFEPVLPYLPSSIHAYVLTQRGHGDADRPATGYTPSDFAADIADFMNALKIDSAIIAGSSMGSVNGQRFAMDYPERVRGLVLMGAFVNMRDNPAVGEFEETVISNLVDPIDPALALDFQQSTLAKPIPESLLNTVVEESLKVPARVWKAVFKGCINVDFSGELKKVKAPTLILWGDQDVFSPRADQETLASGIANAHLVVYQGGGHAIHWEDPARVAADLTAFTSIFVR